MRLPGLPIFALVAFASCTPAKRVADQSQGPSSMRVVGYLASWGVGTKGTVIADLPARDLTHVFYAFAKIGRDGRVVMMNPCIDIGSCSTDTTGRRDNFGELRQLKKGNPHLRISISIGGWTDSGNFSDAALTDSSRKLFAQSAVDMFIRHNAGVFDGIDIDWEFPVAGGMEGNVERPVDKENFTLLLRELRRQLDSQGSIDHRHYELTIAASARPQEIANVEISRIEPLLDFINVMTYDYHSGPGRTNFNAPLYAAAGDPTPELNVDVTMRAFLAAGVPAGKLLVGIPFYGHGYGNVHNTNRGLFQQGTGSPGGWSENDGNWKVLAQTRLKDPRYVRYWEPNARVPWLYDSTSGTWISYDDPQSVAEKVKYVREHGLGGVVIWELGGDDRSLMQAIRR